MSDVSEHSDSEFYFPKKKKRKKKEKRGGHMIKCLLTELGRARRENIWPSVMAYGPSADVRTPWPRAKYFPVRPSHSVNKYIFITCKGDEGSYLWTPDHSKKRKRFILS